jgi:hypothetical protein
MLKPITKVSELLRQSCMPAPHSSKQKEKGKKGKLIMPAKKEGKTISELARLMLFANNIAIKSS